MLFRSDEATFAERLSKANAALSEKQKTLQEEAADKVKLAKQDISKELHEKLKKQEERFTAKRDELQHRIDGLVEDEKRMVSNLKKAKKAQKDAEARAAALARDLDDLQQQVGPVATLVEQAQDNARHGRQMSHQRQLLLQDLVRRARSVAEVLGVEVPNFTPSDDEASYTYFFEEFLGKLEEVAVELDKRVVVESRELLVIATRRLFCNLVRMHPALDFEAVTAPTPYVTDQTHELAEAYAKKFDQVEVDEDDEDDEEDAGEGTS